MICPKCQYERNNQDDPLIPDYECPACGIIYTKYKPKQIIQNGHDICLDTQRLYDQILEQYAWAIFVLIYIASCDGAFKAQERKIIAQFCLRREGAKELNLDKMEDTIKNLSRISKNDFHRFIRERTDTSETLLDIYNTAKKIINTNSNAHTEQVRAISYLEKAWSKIINV